MQEDNSSRDRRTYIGGRDAAALVGACRYTTPLDVYAKIVHGHAAAPSAAMARGLLIEPGVAEWVVTRRQLAASSYDRDAFFRDDRSTYMAGSVDLVERAGGVVKYVHEIKTTRARGAAAWGPPGSGDVEPSAHIQVQWYMGLCGAVGAYVWMYNLDVDGPPVEYYVPRNNDCIDRLRGAAMSFWHDHILPMVPPAPVKQTSPAAIAAVWPTPVKGKVVEATPQLRELARRYDCARSDEQSSLLEKKRFAGQIQVLVGDGERAAWDGGSVSWSATSLGARVNWEAVANELATLSNTDGAVFQALEHKHTEQRRTTRTLRVHIKNNDDGESW